MMRFLFAVGLFGSFFQGNAQTSKSLSPVVWSNPSPAGTFEQEFGFVKNGKVQLIRLWNAPNRPPMQAILSEVALPSACWYPRWTPAPLSVSPNPSSGALFEVVYGLSCVSMAGPRGKTKIHLIRFHNPRGDSQMVKILSSLELQDAIGENDGWSQAPVRANSQTTGFESLWGIQIGNGLHLLRLRNVEPMISILN